MPICPLCNGRKYDFKEEGNSGYFVECKKCHGTGIIEEQTNEEWWFDNLTTEEKEEWIVKEIKNMAYSFLLKEFSDKDCNVLKGYYYEWLKEKHDAK